MLRRLSLCAVLWAAFFVPGWAQDSTISNLPAASALGGSEPIPCVQSAATKKCTVDQIVTYAGSSLVEVSDIGVTVQAFDADLSAWAGTNPGAFYTKTQLDNLIGASIQAWDQGLSDIAALSPADGAIIVGDGANWTAESGATAQASLGVEVGADVQAFDADLTTLSGPGVLTEEATPAVGDKVVAVIGGSYQVIDWTTFPSVTPTTFLGLLDTPSSYSGEGGKLVAVNSGATALEFVDNVTISSIDDIDDVTLTDLADNEILTSSSGDWINRTWGEVESQIEAVVDVADLQGFSAVLTEAEAAAAYQPLDSDLTSIAALTTTSYGRSVLELADAAAAQTLFDVDPAGTDNSTDVTLAGSLDYLTISGQEITRNAIDLAADVTGSLPAASVSIADSGGLITATDVEGALAENRTAIDAIEGDYLTSSDIGTSVQAYDADLDTWSGVTPSANGQSLVSAANYAAMRGLLDLEAGTDFYSISAADAAIAAYAQPLDSDLTSIAALTTTAAGRTSLTFADPAEDRPMIWDDDTNTVIPGAAASIATEASPAAGDFLLLLDTDDVLRKVDWDDLPSGGGGLSDVVDDTTPQLGGALDTNGFAIEFGDGNTDTSVVRSSAGNLTIEGNVVYRAGGTDVPITDGGTGQSTASAAFGALKQAATTSATGVVEEATDAEVQASTNAKFIDAGHLSSAAALEALSDAATIAVDWSAAINFSVTITTNRILGNPANEVPGQYRTVYVISDGGPDTLTFGSEYGGTPPTLDDITTTKAYVLTIYCVAAGHFIVTAVDGSPP